MNVAVQRIRDYLLSEECHLPLRHSPEDTEGMTQPKKKVKIRSKNQIITFSVIF